MAIRVTDVSHKNHATMANEIEEGLHISMFFEDSTYSFCLRLVLQDKYTNISSHASREEESEG